MGGGERRHPSWARDPPRRFNSCLAGERREKALLATRALTASMPHWQCRYLRVSCIFCAIFLTLLNPPCAMRRASSALRAH